MRHRIHNQSSQTFSLWIIVLIYFLPLSLPSSPTPSSSFSSCHVQIGSFEHNLTTDLLNHLVFLQKVFMKEVNEVIQKVSGNEEDFRYCLFFPLISSHAPKRNPKDGRSFFFIS